MTGRKPVPTDSGILSPARFFVRFRTARFAGKYASRRKRTRRTYQVVRCAPGFRTRYRDSLPVVGAKTLGVGGVRVVDIADGKADDLRRESIDDIKQAIPARLGMHIHDLNLMPVFYRTGHIIESERVHRIRLCVRIGGNQQHAHSIKTSSLLIFQAAESFHRCMRPGL